MKSPYFIFLLILSFTNLRGQPAREHVLSSPDGGIRTEIRLEDRILIRVWQGEALVLDGVSPVLSLKGGRHLGRDPRLKDAVQSSHKEILKPVIPVKSSGISDHYNELLLAFRDHYSLRIRAYPNGITYRFETGLRDEILVEDETVDLEFAGDYTVYYPEEQSLISHYERVYQVKQISEIEEKSFCSLPVLFKTGAGSFLLITEADLYDYPCLFLERSGKGFASKFPKYVLEVEQSGDRKEIIRKEAAYIARTEGERSFPWRVFVLADDPSDLISCSLVWQLSRPLQLENTGWIRPGKVAWEWWNAMNVKGVDFESGLNTATYRYYIDFASRFGLEYILMDEGWSRSTTNIREPAEDIDLQALIRYGQEKGVGIILWALWKPLEEDLTGILDLYRDWGVKGIKVDFMQRADQYMVNYYERVAREAAARELLVDFHGAFKPGGLRRAYPNVVNYEGVKGMENNKWSHDISPQHDLTIPFIRMVAGPMDFTPGAMDNAQKENFFPRYMRPMSQGTRCHQVAMYVIYESPIQMLADNPTNYLMDETCTRFIARIPTVWDETVVLEAQVAESLVLARRRGNAWYIGGMTDWTARSFEIPLDFLPDGEYGIEILQDGVNAEKWASDYKRIETGVSPGDTIRIEMAKGGGWAAIIEPSDAPLP